MPATDVVKLRKVPYTTTRGYSYTLATLGVPVQFANEFEKGQHFFVTQDEESKAITFQPIVDEEDDDE